MSVELAYHYLYLFAITVLSLLLVVMLIRAIIGPRVTDRVLSINMIGTMVIAIIAISSLMNEEAFLVDVALIYAMISFLSVLILAMVFIPDGVKRRKFFDRDTVLGAGHPAGDDGAVRLGKWLKKTWTSLKTGLSSKGEKQLEKKDEAPRVSDPAPEKAEEKGALSGQKAGNGPIKAEAPARQGQKSSSGKKKKNIRKGAH